MGKRQHQKDKMYLTSTEWSTLYGGKKTAVRRPEDEDFRRLPFDHCSLSMQPFHNPLCSPEGHIFDLEAIVPFLKKFKINPCTGKRLDSKALVRLNFHKNSNGEYHCPVMFKPFTCNTHIVAVKTTGNVFSHQAIEELNVKTKNWKELLTDEPFTRNDLITLQDPRNLDKFNLQTFHHLKHNMKVGEAEDYNDPKNRLKNVNLEARDILKELEQEYKAPKKSEEENKVADSFNAAHFSKGKVAASFTSTVMGIETKQEAAVIEDDEVIYQRIKKKGYVRLVTNHGPLNLELYCNMVPKTCDNFLKLCQNGYYEGTIFHRSIRNFMIQGGDPTGTGLGGQSIWGKPFKDEHKPNLSHTGRGILSMANSGTDTNKSQFFITYRSCKHLDGKHTIFGHLVGGLETLASMERVETDNKDKPIDDITIEKCQIFTDPFEEAAQQLEKEREDQKRKEASEKAELKRPAKCKDAGVLRVYTQGVGKYIDPSKKFAKKKPEKSEPEEPSSKKQKPAGYKFGDFSCF